MIAYRLFALVATLQFSSLSFAQVAQSSSAPLVYPAQSWNKISPVEKQNLDASAACQDFAALIEGRKPVTAVSANDGKKQNSSQRLLTDGVIIVRDGVIQYEYHNGTSKPKVGGYSQGYLAQTPHPMWSASKTLTALMVGAAIESKVKYTDRSGRVRRLTMQTRVADFIDRDSSKVKFHLLPSEISGEFNNSPSALESYRAKDKKFFEELTLENLVDMSSNLYWDESYEGGITNSSFLPSLWVDSKHGGGFENMLQYVLAQPMLPYGPSKIWNYSGGNVMMVQAILRKVYGEAVYSTLPWTLLFDRLQIPREQAIWERDGHGLFVATSYAHLSLDAMARIGYLLLNNGKWVRTENSKKIEDQILSAEWVRESQQIAPSVSDPSSHTPMHEIKNDGIFSKRAFWLNQSVTRLNEKGEMETYGPEFLNSPRDLFFAAGHYGQLIYVIPSENLVFVRTGHDEKYWANVDEMVSSAVACYGKGARP